MSSDKDQLLPHDSPPPYSPEAYPSTTSTSSSAPYPPQPEPGYPPQSGYPPQPQVVGGATYHVSYQTQGVYQAVATQPQPVVVAMAMKFGEVPQLMDCPYCHARIVTRTEKVAGNLVYLACGLMFIFMFWLCCCIPFCIDSMQDVVHRCPNCSSVLGRCERLK